MSVRDLPEDVHRRLADRASPEGRSLQRYLVAELTRMADRMTPEEFVARVETNDGGGSVWPRPWTTWINYATASDRCRPIRTRRRGGGRSSRRRSCP